MITVVIPSIGCSNLFYSLIQTVLADEGVTRVCVMENHPTRTEALSQLGRHGLIPHDRLLYVNYSGPIYRSWNLGMDLASLDGEDALAVILNDDIVLCRDGCSAMAEVFGEYRDYGILGFQYERGDDEPFAVDQDKQVRRVHGTFRHRGLGGFAFAVRAGSVRARVDDRFEWWYGDDDLVRQTMAEGWRVGVVDGIPVSHPHPATSMIRSGRHDELRAAIERDVAIYESKWGAGA